MMMTINIVYSADLLPMVHARIIAPTEIINMAAALTNAFIADQPLQDRAQIIARTESTSDNFKARLLRKPYEYGLHE